MQHNPAQFPRGCSLTPLIRFPPHLFRKSQTIKGVTYQIRDDEIVLPDDPRGEAKIDSFGNLLGGKSASQSARQPGSTTA